MEYTENFLERWKKECYFLSSEFNYKNTFNLKRSDVDSTYAELKEYFGLEYFMPSTVRNWLHTLLINYHKPACILLVFEISNLLDYAKTLSGPIQRKLKSLRNNPKQFRDMLFEIFTYRLLDANKIPNIKKPFEGKKELEGTCTINGKEYLFECKKLYSPDSDLLETIAFALDLLFLQLHTLNKGFGFIGTIRFENPNSLSNKKNVESKIKAFINEFNSQTWIKTIEYEDNSENISLNVIDYSQLANLELEKDHENYHITFRYVPPSSPTPGIPVQYGVILGASFGMPQWKIYRKFFNAIQDKRKQHQNSKYQNKIYFIDSEFIPDLSLPIFQSDSMVVEEEISNFVKSMSEEEIVCIIRREYMSDVPKISIEAFGKNLDSSLKFFLESLNTNLDYDLSVS